MNADLNQKIESVNTDINRKERDYLFDNIKGLLIFSVVVAHYFRASASFSVPTFGGVAYIISFSYIMQGFLFVSGYFSRNLAKCRQTAFKMFLFPYLLMMPIMYFIRYSIFGHAHFDITLPTMALWYLLTLFVYRFLLKDLVRIPYILPISLVVAIAAGLVPSLDSTLSLGRTFSFLPFFLFGYYFKADWIEKIRRLPKICGWGTLALLIGACSYIAFSRAFPITALYMKSSYASTHLSVSHGIIVRIVIYLLAMAWIFVFVSITPKAKTILSGIGLNTMPVYILHIIMRYAVKSMGEHFGQDIPSYLILIVAALLSVWLFSRPPVAKWYDRTIDIIYEAVIATPLKLARKALAAD
jgi:fucose 4-O-acetylase-like acetyltransferase